MKIFAYYRYVQIGNLYVEKICKIVVRYFTYFYKGIEIFQIFHFEILVFIPII